MSSETFALVRRDLRTHAEAVKVVVLYHGGEPLLNKGFVDMVRQVKAEGVPFVKTVSNGMLLSDAVAAGLVASGLDAIEFSLDGESPEQNDLVRRECDYATVVASVKRLIGHRRAAGSDRPQIFIASTQFPPEGVQPGREEPAPPAYLVREFGGTGPGEIAGFKCTWAMQWPHMEVRDDLYEVYRDPASRGGNTCDKVLNTITVRWNGDVVACCYDLTSRYVLGNVHQERLGVIWNNRRALGLRRSIDRRRLIPLCAACNEVQPKVYLRLKAEVRARLESASSDARWPARRNEAWR